MIWETETILTIATIISTLGGAALIVIKLWTRIREFWQKHKSGFWKYVLVGGLAYTAGWLSFIVVSPTKDSLLMAILVEATGGEIRPEMTEIEAGFAIDSLLEDYQGKARELDRLRQDAQSGQTGDPDARAVLAAQIDQLNQQLSLWKKKARHCKYTVYLGTAPENQFLVDRMSIELAKNGFQIGGFDPEARTENEIYYFEESDEARQVAAEIEALIQARDDLAVHFPKPADFISDASRPNRDIVVFIRSNLHAGRIDQ